MECFERGSIIQYLYFTQFLPCLERGSIIQYLYFTQFLPWGRNEGDKKISESMVRVHYIHAQKWCGERYYFVP